MRTMICVKIIWNYYLYKKAIIYIQFPQTYKHALLKFCIWQLHLYINFPHVFYNYHNGMFIWTHTFLDINKKYLIWPWYIALASQHTFASIVQKKVQIGIKGHCQGQGVIESQSQTIKSKLLRRLCVWKGFFLFKLDETQTLVSWTFAFQFVWRV